MRFAPLILTVLIVLPTGVQAQETGAQDAAEPMPMPMPASDQPSEAQSVAAPATTGPRIATLPNLEDRSGWPEPTADSTNYSYFMTELLEYRENRAAGAIRWDIYGWYGGDVNRLWVKTEGLQGVSEPGGGEQEAQLLYGRLISPFFDFQAGVRFANRSGPGPNQSRAYAAIGVQGVAPYRYSLEPTLFISQDGKVSMRATATYDQQLTQRLILQPRFEFDAAVQKDRSFGVGSGLNKTELGVRLRYEIEREFAPYVGVSWTQNYGSTKRLARAEGEDASLVSIVAGVRMWF